MTQSPTRTGRVSRSLRCIGAVLASLCCLVPSAQANLIVNGSFEIPTVPQAGLTNFLSGSTAISGWTVVGVDSAVTSTAFTQSGITFQAQDGRQWIDLAGVTSNSQLSGVTQAIATDVGTVYDLDFYVGSATDGSLFFPSTVDLSINAGPRISHTNATAPGNALDWRHFSTTFSATGTNTVITFYNRSAPDNFLGALDNVSLSAIPEPSELALGVAGLACVLSISRRRLNQAASNDA